MAQKRACAAVEVHFLGELQSVSVLGESAPISVRWTMASGPSWRHVQGFQSGQTHACMPNGSSKVALLSHPLDVHYAATGLAGWPRLSLTVVSKDGSRLCGYGVVNVPCSPGVHELDVALWLPHASLLEQLSHNLFGGKGVRLVHEDAVHSQINRRRLQSRSTGSARVSIAVVLKDFERFAIATS